MIQPKYKGVFKNMVITKRSKKVIIIASIIVILCWLGAGYKKMEAKRAFDGTAWYQVTGTYEGNSWVGKREDEYTDTDIYREYFSYYAKDGNKYYYSRQTNGDSESNPDITIYVDEANPSHCTTISDEESAENQYIVLTIGITICALIAVYASIRSDCISKWIMKDLKRKNC